MSKVGGYLAMPNTICSGHPTKSGRAKKFIKSTKTKNKALASKIDLKYQEEAVEEMKLGGNRITFREATTTCSIRHNQINADLRHRVRYVGIIDISYIFHSSDA